ncbi:hypothetical protein COB57_03655 [Candidatus Peregrinibacteria bacterium]|nr:MAG: hypothetical protein COB57_03655 [Candidatus Peregrinibacteria bacterium]
MIKNIIVSLVVSCFLFSGVFAQELILKKSEVSANAHYSFSVPEGWKEIPKDVIEDAYRTIGLKAPRKVFQKDVDQYFQYPYFSLDEGVLTAGVYNSFLQLAESQDEKGGMREVLNKKAKDVFEESSSVDMGNISINEAGDVLSIQSFMKVGGEEIQGDVLTLFGKDHYVTIGFSRISGQDDGDSVILENIVHSFSFDEGFKFEGFPSQQDDYDESLGRIFGQILGFVLAICLGIYIKKYKS